MTQVAAFVIAGGQSSRMGRDKAFLALDGRTLLERALELAHSVSQDVKLVGRREKYEAYGPVIEDLYPGQGPLAGIHAALTASASELNLMIGVDTPFLEARFLRYLIEQAEASGAVVTVPVTSCQLPVASFQESEREVPVPHPVAPKTGATRVGHIPVTGFQFPVSSFKRPESERSVPHPAQDPSTRVSRAGEGAREPSLARDDIRGDEPCNSPNGAGQAQPLCAVYRREFAAIAEEALRQRRNNIVPLFAKVTTREIGDAELRKMAFDPAMFDNLNTPEEWQQACHRAKK